ncbi:hypothetical protein LGH82_17630 [Mesorhizobium sp. PAMC28654]|uniref:HGGxSTG domain-containing protein n=1 Tax=Mesorhizobium sp. PAMC28654 TaxID=2880934 RepID=UPI001D0AEE91|nr:HGGxSTG domain-containing protein [Mesorhizobium sp. PAMC28654]UDL87039.1 hypothetical protein LGH82_17630 [Mesorhizobium sp. PAMC28654]
MTNMRTLSIAAMLAAVREAEIQAEQEARKSAAEARARGRLIEPRHLIDWIRYGWLTCPATEERPIFRLTCKDEMCAAGAMCQRRAVVGLFGDGEPMPRKVRPLCGARARTGNPCQMRVEPGKAKCRLHGGLSTGPKTAEGKARIAAATRDRYGAS